LQLLKIGALVTVSVRRVKGKRESETTLISLVEAELRRRRFASPVATSSRAAILRAD
jgi:hypothetical protein